jgi:hypothetical protein
MLLAQPKQHLAHATQLAELAEDQLQRLLDALIGVHFQPLVMTA